MLTPFLNAQTVKITGRVTDSLGTPLKLANIIAKKQADSSVVGFAIADPQGVYKIRLRTEQQYLLIASVMGMQPVKEEILVSGQAENKVVNFQLYPQPNQLQGVELVYEMPVKIKGDTIM